MPFLSPAFSAPLRWLCCLALAGLLSPAQGQSPPAEEEEVDRRTELMHARAYAHAMERQMVLLMEKFPAMKTEIEKTQGLWTQSPLAQGKRALEEEMLREGGEAMKAELEKIDRSFDDPVKTVQEITGEAELRLFLQRVEDRAGGDIKIPAIRGQLLSYCPKYRNQPEMEMLEGYHTPVTTRHGWVKVTLSWPMSWKPTAARNPAMFQKHVHVYGHGHLHGNVQVIPLPQGQTVEEAFNACTIESEKRYFKSLGLDLMHFEEMHRETFNQTDGRHTLRYKIATAEGPMGTAPLRAAVIEFKTFYEGQMIILFFNCPGPANSPMAKERLEKYAPMFQQVANSMKLNSGDMVRVRRDPR
ncbi:hypothetical protein EI77_01835 [Prosthecobacter fusiformis]|uniref:DUF3347 domain-containing protein n=1 Tax=Prosthecobacter fusiformis TaxID=48464 RepID=A0A4R7S799_9BACT|nr:hypothetical protein [Prosthecobacter fusiformis]TDU73365.1 hypothetical protein EI77_01835 [Prosthecobacter fusiformis]